MNWLLVNLVVCGLYQLISVARTQDVVFNTPSERTKAVNGAKFTLLTHKVVYQSTYPSLFYADWHEQAPFLFTNLPAPGAETVSRVRTNQPGNNDKSDHKSNESKSPMSS